MDELGTGPLGLATRDLPDGWETAPVRELLAEESLRARDVQDGIGLPILSLTKDRGLITQETRFTRRVARADVGDYKVVRRGWIAYNPMVLWEGAIHELRRMPSGLVSPIYVVLSTKPRVDSDYMGLVLRSRPALVEYERLASGVVKRRRVVRREAFLGIQVAVPPLIEQQGIARVLRAIRGAIEATDGVMAASRELRLSLLRSLYSRGTRARDSVGTEPSSGVMPPPAERWAHRRLGDLIAVGPQNGIYRPGSQYGSGTPIVRIEDYGLDGDIISTSRRRVALDAEAVALYALTPGDILVNRVNSISHLGKAAMVGDLPEPTVFESNMMRFSLDTTLVLPAFVMRFLASGLGRDQLVARARRAVAQSSINQSDVQAVMCPVPPLEEQQLVVDVLSSIDRKITAEIQRRDALAGLYATLTGDLLSARMRVEVVDPNGGAR